MSIDNALYVTMPLTAFTVVVPLRVPPPGFVPIATVQPTSEPESPIATIAKDIEEAEFGLTLPAFYFARRADIPRDVEEIQLALDFG